MSWHLSIRKAEIKDLPKIQQLINACATPHKSLDYLRWWNFGSLIPTVTFCAIGEDIFVGMFMVYKRKLTNGLKCGVLMGLGILESWRGKGLLKILGQEAMNYFRDIDLFVCLPNQNGRKALEKNLNFQTIGSVNTMVIDIDRLNVQKNHYVREQLTPETVFYNYDSVTEGIFMFRCDNEFRKWRFSDHPRYSYQSIRMENDDFLIVNIYTDEISGIRYGDIVDFELSFFGMDQIRKMINCACISLKNDVDQLTIQAIPNSRLYGFVKEIGFYENGIGHNFCLKVTNSQNDHLCSAPNWLIKWSDYMR